MGSTLNNTLKGQCAETKWEHYSVRLDNTEKAAKAVDYIWYGITSHIDVMTGHPLVLVSAFTFRQDVINNVSISLDSCHMAPVDWKC